MEARLLARGSAVLRSETLLAVALHNVSARRTRSPGGAAPRALPLLLASCPEDIRLDVERAKRSSAPARRRGSASRATTPPAEYIADEHVEASLGTWGHAE
jgi:hypothetical protein